MCGHAYSVGGEAILGGRSVFRSHIPLQVVGSLASRKWRARGWPRGPSDGLGSTQPLSLIHI
eukprot:11315737-Alexandrium_andersonii.AAC.1